VSIGVKNQEPWATWIEEVWKMYQSNGFSEDSLQLRQPSIPTTSRIPAWSESAMTSVREETARHNADDSLLPPSSQQSQYCSGNEHEIDASTHQPPPPKIVHELVAASTLVDASTTPTRDQYNMDYLLSHRNKSLVPLIKKWLDKLDPCGQKRYGRFSGRLPQNYPYWPSDVPYSTPGSLTVARKYFSFSSFSSC
jgi:hypothetical protein